MIAHPQMLQPKRRRVFATGRILSARTVAWLSRTAASLRNEAQEAVCARRYNTAQTLLSEAELLEYEISQPSPNAVALDDILFLQYGSQ